MLLLFLVNLGFAGGGTPTLIVEDTHDGEPTRRKRHKEYQERRRQQIEDAFNAAFENPATAEKAIEIASTYIPRITVESAKKADFSQFNLKPEHFDWLQSVLQKKQDNDEEDLIMAYLATRH